MGGPASPIKPGSKRRNGKQEQRETQAAGTASAGVDTETARRRGERTLRLILKPVLVPNNTQRLGFRGGLVRVNY